MERLKKIYAHVRDLFLSMTPANRVLVSLLVLVLIFSLGYLVVGSIQRSDPASKYVKIYNGMHFTTEEQRAIENAFADSNLKDYRWVGGDQLEVPKSAQPTYIAAISLKNAVNPKGSALNDAAKNLSTWDSSKIMDERIFQAKSQLIAESIAKFPGVVSAEVIANKRDKWDKNVWAREKVPSIAVYVDAVYFKPLPDETIVAIGNTIASAFGVTNKREITISDRRNSRTYYGNGEDVESNGASAYAKAQKKYQDFWNKEIHEMLNIKGLQVQTSFFLTTRFNERALDVTQRIAKDPFYKHDSNYNLEAESRGFAARPGQISMGTRPLINPTTAISDGSKLSEKRDENEITKSIGGIEERYEVFPLVPERVTATLLIPRPYILENWLAKNSKPNEPTPEPTPEQLAAEEEELKKTIRQNVGNMFIHYRGESRSADPYDMVQVSVYNPMVDPEIEITNWQKFQAWLLHNWQTLSLMGLVLGGLCVLWTITRPVKPPQIVIYEAPEVPMEVIEAKAQAKAEAEAAAIAAEAAAREEEIDRTLEPFGSIRSIRDEIAELVAENPEAAAAVLRQWIGNVVMAESK
jgi:flagellar biosynthesis/type III secretory pathway M-ring protein FliF/YscJ